MLRIALLAAAFAAFAFRMWKRTRYDWGQAIRQFEDFLVWQFGE